MKYQVRLTKSAVNQFKKLPRDRKEKVREALNKAASLAAMRDKGFRGGRSIKVVRGRSDSFFRLRVSDYRIMYDVIEDESTLLVLGIVNRRDLEQWLKSH